MEHSATGNGMRGADEQENILGSKYIYWRANKLGSKYSGKHIYWGTNAGAKYRNHSYRRRCRGAVGSLKPKQQDHFLFMSNRQSMHLGQTFELVQGSLNLVKALGKYKSVSYWGTAIGGRAGEAGYAPSSAYFATAPNNISLMAKWSTGWINPC